MGKFGDQPRLLMEPLLDLLVDRDFRPQDLQRQNFAHPDVLDLVDRAHPTFAKFLGKPVTAIDNCPGPRAGQSARFGREAAKIFPARGAEVR